MTKAYEKTLENYAILYQYSNQPYKQNASWTTSKTFVPDKNLDKPSFVQDTEIEKSEFVLDKLFGTDDWN